MPTRYKDGDWTIPVLDEDAFIANIRKDKRNFTLDIAISNLCGYSDCDDFVCDTCPWDKVSTAKSYLSDLGIKEEDYG
jgi:hypothetical protein